jgi:hypothetical protein
MKFNWGTGIGLFLLLFLIALIAFVVFAWNQDVNLVHKDYYEQGVDYSAQIDRNARSAPLAELIEVREISDSVQISFPANLAERIDSGSVLFFRPSDYNLDLTCTMHFRDSLLTFGKKQLIPGRYIVKMTWYSAGIDFEVDKMFVIK